MKFYEAPRGSAEAVSMSDDNSDGVSTDGGTPPEYNNNQTPAVTYEITTYTAEEGIVLYPYDPNNQNSRNAEVGGEYEGEPSPSSSYQHFESNEQDLATVENLENLRNRLNNYMNATCAHASVLYQGSGVALSDTDSDDSTDNENIDVNAMEIDNSPIEPDRNPPPPPSPRYNL